MTLETVVTQLSLGTKRLLLALYCQGGQKEFIVAGGPQWYETVRQLLKAGLAECCSKVVRLKVVLTDEIKETLIEEVLM